MSYFVVFSFELTEGSLTQDVIHRFEEIGLRGAIDSGNGILHMPANSYIGEYDFNNAEDLKNALYIEIKEIFEDFSLEGPIFVAVSEFATIGIDRLP